MTKAEEKSLLQREIFKLPLKQRETITLRINEELPFSEIANILGCSANSAKVNFQHGVNQLNKVLKNEEEKK